jgi:hypothetical protein
VYSVTGTQIDLQMVYGLTVHTSVWRLSCLEEKCGFPCAILHKTRKYSAVLGSKLLYRISDRSIRSTEGTDRHLSVTKPIFTQTTFASRCFAHQIGASLGFYDAQSRNSVPTLRDNISCPSSSFKQSITSITNLFLHIYIYTHTLTSHILYTSQSPMDNHLLSSVVNGH